MFEDFESYEHFEQKTHQIDDELHEKFTPGIEQFNKLNNQAATDRSGEWVEMGYQNIPINNIDISDAHVHSENDFHKVSFDEMRRGMGILESEVRPLVEGHGASKGYFEQLDRSQPLDGGVSRTTVYDSFYGEKIKTIRVAKTGNHYEVENGYHRIYVAKELNMSSVPALVKVRV